MTGSSWTLVELCKNIFADRSGNLHVVLLEEHEVRVAFDTNVGELNPLVVVKAHLLEVLNKAVVICDMWTGLARDHDVWHLAELGELVDGASLKDAGALGQAINPHLRGSDGGAVRHWWVELQWSICKTARSSNGATNSSDSVVSNQRGER